ncbi:MAG TPA: uroporphyrinogen decarboxylase family protein [Thermoguttaceae bacterium]|nr:uroporphyrinogen decarboxylase family protein [Thermoguttaceae bacterium]
MTSRDRILAALNHTEPDCTPCDYFTTPEIRDGLRRHFGLGSVGQEGGDNEGDNGVAECLGTDIRYIAPPYIGPPLPTFGDGSVMNLWGVRRRPMANEYGEYAEPVGTPYAEWDTVDEAAAFPWPDPDWYDYDAVESMCGRYPGLAIAAGGFHVQDFINGVAFGRGVERVLMDIATEDPVYLYLVERRQRFYLEHIERTLVAGKGRIDLVLCGDDFGSQRGPLISPATFDRLFAPKKKEFFDMVHSHGAKVTHHCCGSSRALIPHFIECGMDSLQTIQARAAGMDPYGLKRDFGDRITLHGAVDVQGWLQHAAPAEVECEVNRLMDEVGAGGGFIIAPSHCIQPDTPLDNVLAFYHTVRKRRS